MPGRMTRIRASFDRIPHYRVYFFTRVGFTGLVMEETRLASGLLGLQSSGGKVTRQKLADDLLPKWRQIAEAAHFAETWMAY
jgi:hypothetical protein